MKKIFNKNIAKSLFFSLPLLIAASCSDSDNQVVNPDENGTQTENALYITLTAAFPAGTRAGESTTENGGSSSTGTEDGTAAESTITKAKIYFCDATSGEVVVTLEPSGAKGSITQPSGYSSDTWKLKAKVELEELKQMAGKNMNMFVVGNYDRYTPGTAIEGTGNGAMKATFSMATLETAPIGSYTANTGNSLPLVNADVFNVDFSGVTPAGDNDSDISAFLRAIHAIFDNNGELDLSNPTSSYVGSKKTLQLERSVARVDWKDGDRTTGKLNGYSECVYPLGDIDNHTLKLVKMQMFNVNKTSNLFRQAVGGTNEKATSTAATLLGFEKADASGTAIVADGYNWLSDPTWSYGTDSWIKSTDNFLSPLTISGTGASKTWTIEGTPTTIETIKAHGTSTTPNQEGYYPWCYISENTIPNVDLMDPEDDSKLPANATGVAFTFQVCSDVNGTAVTGTSGESLRLIMPNSYYQDVPYKTDGYYLTYYAYLKHNNASDINNKPAPMKYGVVRNNIYQIRVTSVDHLPNPNEPMDMYLELDVKVLPWQKRVNDFEF